MHETTLSEALVDALDRPMDEAVLHRAALHVLDWTGCALVGLREPVGRAMAALCLAPPFSLAGSGQDQAVAALGGLGSLLEMDDVHKAALLHPGPVVVPVIMALPGTSSAPSPLAALIRGYEAMIRLGRAAGPSHYAFFHHTGTCGGVGAAVAAAHLLGLDRGQTVSAIGHALSMAGGLWQTRNERSDTKHLHIAEAARRGVLAARYAQHGLSGPRAIIEGPQGFFAAMAPGATPDALTRPAPAWLIHDVSFKPWPACRHVHPAIDAALALRARVGDAPGHLDVATYRDALVFCDKPAPETADEARFSLQHGVAVAFMDGAPTPAAFLPENLPRYQALRRRVSVMEDPAITARYPAHFGARITARPANTTSSTASSSANSSSTASSTESISHDMPDAWGDPENPMDEPALVAKFHRLAASAGMPCDRATALAQAVLALPQGGNMDAIYPLLTTD